MSKRGGKIHAVEQAGRVTATVARRLFLAMIAGCAAIGSSRFDRGFGRASGNTMSMGNAMNGNMGSGVGG
jgi:hypothetical protein